MHDAPYDDEDLEISTDGRDLSDALHLPTENRVFYHGTNKRLTLNEAVQLARHHVDVKMHAGWDDRKSDLHDQRMRELRSILVRYGIHGWGEAKDLNGIVVFATDRLSVREVVVSVPNPEMSDAFHAPTRRHDPHASLEAMITTMHRATNRGAANTRRWFAEANQALGAGEVG